MAVASKPMTVKDLREALSKFPEDALVAAWDNDQGGDDYYITEVSAFSDGMVLIG